MEKVEGLSELKEDYNKLQKKYDLPSFEELNEDFQIEKISEAETDFLIREVRKLMSDKFSNYLRMIEAFLNPVSVPMFVFSIVKKLGTEEKNKLSEAYKTLAKLEIDLIELDVKFSEEKEVAFIKNAYAKWKNIQLELLGVVSSMKNNFENKFKVNGKSYFG